MTKSMSGQIIIITMLSVNYGWERIGWAPRVHTGPVTGDSSSFSATTITIIVIIITNIIIANIIISNIIISILQAHKNNLIPNLRKTRYSCHINIKLHNVTLHQENEKPQQNWVMQEILLIHRRLLTHAWSSSLGSSESTSKVSGDAPGLPMILALPPGVYSRYCCWISWCHCSRNRSSSASMFRGSDNVLCSAQSSSSGSGKMKSSA